MFAFSQTFVHRHREEVAVLVSSATFLAGALALVWLIGLPLRVATG